MISKPAIDFNKEILFGEVGAIIGAPTTGFIVSRLTSSANLIASLSVAGAIIGAAIFWLAMRAYDKRRQGHLTMKLARDIEYFTPAAFILASVIYYPSLFYFSKYLLLHEYKAVTSVALSQVSAFILFLIAINIYRYFLFRLFGKRL